MSVPSADPRELLAAARADDRRSLGRLLTLVEDGSPATRGMLRELSSAGRQAHVVGVTGPPGAGKSSLVSALVGAVRGSGRSVAVLAVDPSSPVTGGAILGDRVRMQEHARDLGVFIRSMASRGQPGGLAAATRDAATVLAGVGFDLVLVETVGAGQGEVAVAGLVDTTLVVEAPGMGDEVQALKAGLMEMADIVVVSKADLPGADRAAAGLRAMLTGGTQHDRALGDRPRPKRPEVLLASSTAGTGIEELLAAIDRRAPARPAGVPAPPAHGPATLRPLTAADDRALFRVFRLAIDDLVRREGHPEGWPFDPADDDEWQRWRPIYEHLRSTAEAAWGAEADGVIVGYARSIRRGDARELTELFVLPEAQGAGVGVRLLERAFPGDGHRAIVASSDAAAISRYLRLGLVATSPAHLFTGPPASDPVGLPPGVLARPLAELDVASRWDLIARVDAEVLGMRRDVDHAWLGEHRSGWLLERSGEPLGYAYAAEQQGPIAVLEPGLMPGAIGLVEAETARRGTEALRLWTPLANGSAVRHLLARGYRMDPDPVYLLEDAPRISAARYVLTSPPLIL